MSEHDGDKRENRLAGESSPYLLLHRHNPVDWYPWGEEALERARSEQQPIFLSVGYSTCYWCHVMERESFTDPGIAERMNRDFVNVKVDREERPDLDEIYMAATQILTGQGGWPNSVFLTPELEPYFAGTYFPPEDRHGRPGFPTVLRSMAEAWRTRRDEVEEQAASIGQALTRYLEDRGDPGAAAPSAEVAAVSFADLERRFDVEHGGFGGAPKFPTPSNLFLLAELAAERPEADRMLTETLDKMARGGIYDQLGGGFHRYATDSRWMVPHFEKMLYDNGFLVELYARQAERTGDPEMARVAREIAAYLAREMTSPEGAFWSAQDAETEGEEGAFYVWRRDELAARLDEEELGFLAPLYGFDGAPFFEGDRYVLHLPRPLAEQADRRRLSLDELHAQIEPLRARLLKARGEREQPLIDNKILADWNGIAIAGLAEAGRRLDEPAMVEQAAAAAEFVLDRMRPDGGPLLHSWRAGEGRITAFLADYAQMVRGCLALYRSTDEERWLAAGRELATEQEERLGDPAGGYWGAAEAPDLLVRSKEVFDGAAPGANAVAALNLLQLARLDDDPRWRRRCGEALAFFGPLIEEHPQAARMMTIAARRFAADTGAGSDSDSKTGSDSASDPVELELVMREPDADGWRGVELELRIADGWHLTAADAEGPGVAPTRFAGVDLELEGVEAPPGEPLRLSDAAEPLSAWSGRVIVKARVRPTGERPRLRLVYQPCDDRSCLQPVERMVPIG